MQPGAQDTATPIELRIERAIPRADEGPHRPPRSARRSAAGHPRQPRDGRGLSRPRRRVHPDHRRRRPPMLRFPVLFRAKARQGQERPLDATTTRSLTGLGYPGARPAGQVLRSGHGAAGRDRARHGRPPRCLRARLLREILRGHGLSRPRQLHRQFQRARSIPYGIEARKGWMALNFFYNTGIDANNVITFDEPWSRPGDYVLLRAVTDLVCVSSACPDDIDAANAWNPTDIHVRTYSDKSASRERCPSHDARLRTEAHARDRVPPKLRRAHARFHRVSRLLAAAKVQQRAAPSPNTGRAASARPSWTCRRSGNSRSPAPTPKR